MKLSLLSDKELLISAKSLVKEENRVRTQLLHHLKEIEARRLFVDLGYSSLFSYAVQELGYSESAAYRRILAARMLKDVPEIGTKVEMGDLSLSNISLATSFFKENSIEETRKKKKVLEQLEGKSRKEAQKVLLQLGGKQAPGRIEEIKRDSVKSHILKFSVSEDVLEKYEELKGLLAHTSKTGLCSIFEFAVTTSIEQLKKKKFKLSPKKEKYSMEKTSTRYIPAGVRRAVFEKSGGRRENCGSNYKLEYDHIKPFSFGGETSEKNLRLLCFSCNQRQRIKAGLRAEASQTL